MRGCRKADSEALVQSIRCQSGAHRGLVEHFAEFRAATCESVEQDEYRRPMLVAKFLVLARHACEILSFSEKGTKKTVISTGAGICPGIHGFRSTPFVDYCTGGGRVIVGEEYDVKAPRSEKFGD